MAFVGNEMAGAQAFHTFSCARAVCNVATGDHGLGRPAIGIDCQVLVLTPPFVRAMASLPPRAPVPCRCTLQCVASIMSQAKSGSSMKVSSNFSRTPLSRQRQKCLRVFFQPPYCGGKSRQGAPVRKIHMTALIEAAIVLGPLRPGKCGSSKARCWSDISWRCCSSDIKSHYHIVVYGLFYDDRP